MSETLASAVELFLASRRALGRKYHSEESELRLLLRFAGERGAGRLDQLTRRCWRSFWHRGRDLVREASTTSSASWPA